MSGAPASPSTVEVVRSGVVESTHTATVAVLGADGALLHAAGDVDAPVFPRSSNKPLQAVGLLEAGLDLPDDLLALACASHSGEPYHVAGVRRLLATAGLDESALRTPPDLPLDREAATRLLRAGGGRDPVLMNCSGKHAGMLAACVAAGWPTGSYLDADHPLQRGLRAAVERLTGEPVAAVGVDGCGAPLFAVGTAGLARGFAALATAPEGTPEHRVARAMTAHPELVGGTGRDVTRAMRAVPGLVAKDGAEGVYAAGLASGAAVALKVHDGAERARPGLLVAALRRAGLPDGTDGTALDAVAHVPVLGHGRPVGEVRAAL
ncbi:asparaginase [Vallicoccus soli]|uniref:Asparaginase n=1 Tax=Vallicoccus soli TaxID=2339232 RepID=A0A3A3Z724_9ACTN|nr:asparaginase [Vallicoccus soli]RJK97727.1 asparaginase [Vallicoccus soli]